MGGDHFNAADRGVEAVRVGRSDPTDVDVQLPVVEDVCAVVVSYHPDAGFSDRLSALLRQAGGLVVVDNGSREAALQPVRQALAGHNRTALLELGENLGIASALNHGVRWAEAQGFRHVVLFDQDSRASEDLIRQMRHCWQRSPWGNRLAILVPRYLDARLGIPIPPDPVREGRVREGLEAAMTSGSFLPIRLFAQLGYFVDELFIDGVDYEFSLRVRARGFVIAECTEAVLHHAPGEPRVIRWRGRRLYQTANYSPVRRYYQERNKIWISRRYFQHFPFFCLKLFLFSTKDLIKIVVAEQDSTRKVRFFLRGVLDGLRGRMGPFRPG